MKCRRCDGVALGIQLEEEIDLTLCGKCNLWLNDVDDNLSDDNDGQEENMDKNLLNVDKEEVEENMDKYLLNADKEEVEKCLLYIVLKVEQLYLSSRSSELLLAGEGEDDLPSFDEDYDDSFDEDISNDCSIPEFPPVELVELLCECQPCDFEQYEPCSKCEKAFCSFHSDSHDCMEKEINYERLSVDTFTTKIEKIIKHDTKDLGHDGFFGSTNGEITPASVKALINLAEITEKDVIFDCGASGGGALFQLVALTNCIAGIGIECSLIRSGFSVMHNIRAMKTFSGVNDIPVHFITGNFTNICSYEGITVLYAFDHAFDPKDFPYMAKAVNASRSIRCVLSTKNQKYFEDYGIDIELDFTDVKKTTISTISGKCTRTIYLYKPKLNRSFEEFENMKDPLIWDALEIARDRGRRICFSYQLYDTWHKELSKKRLRKKVKIPSNSQDKRQNGHNHNSDHDEGDENLFELLRSKNFKRITCHHYNNEDFVDVSNSARVYRLYQVPTFVTTATDAKKVDIHAVLWTQKQSALIVPSVDRKTNSILVGITYQVQGSKLLLYYCNMETKEISWSTYPAALQDGLNFSDFRNIPVNYSSLRQKFISEYMVLKTVVVPAVKRAASTSVSTKDVEVDAKRKKVAKVTSTRELRNAKAYNVVLQHTVNRLKNSSNALRDELKRKSTAAEDIKPAKKNARAAKQQDHLEYPMEDDNTDVPKNLEVVNSTRSKLLSSERMHQPEKIQGDITETKKLLDTIATNQKDMMEIVTIILNDSKEQKKGTKELYQQQQTNTDKILTETASILVSHIKESCKHTSSIDKMVEESARQRKSDDEKFATESANHRLIVQDLIAQNKAQSEKASEANERFLKELADTRITMFAEFASQRAQSAIEHADKVKENATKDEMIQKLIENNEKAAIRNENAAKRFESFSNNTHASSIMIALNALHKDSKPITVNSETTKWSIAVSKD